jgi:predicted DNA-binding transcriptional regulator AlpA
MSDLQFLRISDVCQLLRISKPTLWRLRKGKNFPLPTDVTERVIAWRRCEILTWLAARHHSHSSERERFQMQSLASVLQAKGAHLTQTKALKEPPAKRTRRYRRAPGSTVHSAVHGADEQFSLPLQEID